MLYYIYSLYYYLFTKPIEVGNPNEVATNMKTSVSLVRNTILTPIVDNDPFLIELKSKLASDNLGLNKTGLLKDVKKYQSD
jgi:hypothetical protein